MGELVCLQCGKEMEYDWAPCPHCGWKPPEPWEEMAEDEGDSPVKSTLMAKPNQWIQWTAGVLLGIALLGLVFWFLR